MRSRCLCKSDPSYPKYGGRGIKIDPRWDDFWLFLEDMGERPKGLSIERDDTDGDYTKGNCRWATVREQNSNRSISKRLTLDGITRTVFEWAQEWGVHPTTVYRRFYRLENECR